MSRNEFLARRAYYQQKSDFTKKERSELTFQEQNFVRGIQIIRDMPKNDAIRYYKSIRKRDTEQMKRVSLEIQAFYDKPHILRGFVEPTDTSVIIPKPPEVPTKYEYAGTIQKAKKHDYERFIPIPGKSRKYTDTKTGEIISRRERDKRLYAIVTNY